MIEDIYDYSLTIGELDFKVTGSYIVNNSDDIDIIHDTVFLTIINEHEEIELNGEPFLSGLDAWNVIEDEIRLKIKYELNNESLVSLEDINEEDILGDY